MALRHNRWICVLSDLICCCIYSLFGLVHMSTAIHGTYSTKKGFLHLSPSRKGQRRHYMPNVYVKRRLSSGMAYFYFAVNLTYPALKSHFFQVLLNHRVSQAQIESSIIWYSCDTGSIWGQRRDTAKDQSSKLRSGLSCTSPCTLQKQSIFNN